MLSASEFTRSWHVWIVAIAIFALYFGGLRDFVLILRGDTDYIERQFGPGGVTYFDDYPRPLRVLWAINILGGLTAPVLLLIGSHWVLVVAVLAAISQVVLLVVTFTFLDRWASLGAATSWFDLGVAVVTALFAGYCWWVLS